MTELPLRDIHLPDPISWWPLATGWWILLVTVLILILATWLLLKYYSRPRLRNEIRKELERINQNYHEGGDAPLCLSELSKLLRRVMLSRNPSAKSASATGERWLEHLDESLGETAFSRGAGRVLLSGPYQQQIDESEVVVLLELCNRMVKKL